MNEPGVVKCEIVRVETEKTLKSVAPASGEHACYDATLFGDLMEEK
jgi:hypothetical protein